MTGPTIAGRVASEGVVVGTLRWGGTAPLRETVPATGVMSAIATTRDQLRRLQEGSDSLGADIVQFQVEMLEDDRFVLELLEAALAGEHPAAGVEAFFAREVAEFSTSSSESFAARAADLADLGRRLVGSLSGRIEDGGEWPERTVLLVDDISPTRFLQLDRERVIGIVSQSGSPSSHVAMLARSAGLPMLVATGALDRSLHGRMVMLDAIAGHVLLDPPMRGRGAVVETAVFAQGGGEETGPVATADGVQVELTLTVNALSDLEEASPERFAGIGLVRTELLLPHPEALLQRHVQSEIYSRIFDWAGERPVTIRVFDGGGDKPISGFTLSRERNPALGVRGARLLARRPDVLHEQLAAILGAAAGRPVDILVPMVTLPEEMLLFRRALAEVVAKEALDAGPVRLGMMVETPAAALAIASFDADFFAIGTNDLVQYTMAASREDEALPLGATVPDSVLALIRRVVKEGAARRARVSLCGDAALEEMPLRQLIEAGVRSFAVPARFASHVRRSIREAA